jgi:hypothetical protein
MCLSSPVKDKRKIMQYMYTVEPVYKHTSWMSRGVCIKHEHALTQDSMRSYQNCISSFTMDSVLVVTLSQRLASL